MISRGKSIDGLARSARNPYLAIINLSYKDYGLKVFPHF